MYLHNLFVITSTNFHTESSCHNPVDMFNLGSSYFHVPLSTVRHLLIVIVLYCKRTSVFLTSRAPCVTILHHNRLYRSSNYILNYIYEQPWLMTSLRCQSRTEPQPLMKTGSVVAKIWLQTDRHAHHNTPLPYRLGLLHIYVKQNKVTHQICLQRGPIIITLIVKKNNTASCCCERASDWTKALQGDDAVLV